MNTKCKFWIIISVTVILLLAFCGCEGLGAAVPQSEALTETAPSKETTPLTDNQINSQKTGTGTVLSSRDTFYNCISEIPEQLPVREFRETLAAYGIDPVAAPQYFKTDLMGRYYYSIDLSCLAPLCYTTENELICTIKGDAIPVMLIVLDSAVPKAVRFYPTDSWSLGNGQPTFLVDGAAATSQQEKVCKDLFRTHIQQTGLKQAAILDGDATVQTITVQFEEYPGITYTFFVYHYQGVEETVLYSVGDGYMAYRPLD